MKMWSHFLSYCGHTFLLQMILMYNIFKMYDLKAEIHYQFKRISLKTDNVNKKN